MSCCEDCGENCCSDCVDNCSCCQSCQDSCDACCQNCAQSCCDSVCDSCTCCGNASGISILKINTFTSFTIMMLSLVSGIVGIFEQVPISITFLSIGLILTAFAILGLMVYPRISRNE